MTRERLFRCLFILGSQRADVPRLEEAVKLAQELELNAETEDFAEDIRRDRAVVLVMLAKELDRRERYEEAALFLEKLGPPKNDEAAQFFHHYYEGMVNRGLGQLDEDEARIRKAISSFYRALAIDETNPKVIYMVADCLVQLEEPSTEEVAEMDELVQALQAADVLGSGLMDPLRKRWELRHQMLEEQ